MSKLTDILERPGVQHVFRHTTVDRIWTNFAEELKLRLQACDTIEQAMDLTHDWLKENRHRSPCPFKFVTQIDPNNESFIITLEPSLEEGGVTIGKSVVQEYK